MLNRLRELANRVADSDFVNGVAAFPYRVAGAPVDLADTIVRPLAGIAGVNYPEREDIIGSSDWLLSHGVDAGIKQPMRGTNAELAGEVVTGFLDPTPTLEASIVQSVMGKAPQRQIFAGQRAATADLDAMRRAEQRLASGDAPETVWAEEGWFRGPDGKMRFEIDDSGATVHWSGLSKIDPNVEELHRYGSVESSVNHPALSSAYPDIESIPVIAYENMPGLRGSYHHQPWEQIDLSGFAGDSMRSRLLDQRAALEPYASDPDPILRQAAVDQLEEIQNKLARGTYGDREREAMIHELQHAVQSREGFAFGANAEAAGRDAYRRSLGEVEARATQRRRDLTPEQRRARYPLQDYDVPLDELIIRGQTNGPQMSVGQQRRGMTPEEAMAYASELMAGRTKAPLSREVTKANGPSGNRLLELVASYENKPGMTASDVIDEAKSILGDMDNPPPELIRAIENLETSRIDEMDNWGWRGDYFREEENVVDIIRAYAEGQL